MSHTERNIKILAVLMTALGLALLAPSSSLAAFTRPFLRQITGTPTGLGGSLVPFLQSEKTATGVRGRSGPLGLAVDASGNLWVGDSLYEREEEHNKVVDEDYLDEFNSSGAFIGPELGPDPRLLKGGNLPLEELFPIDDATEDFYVTSKKEANDSFSGNFIEVFNNLGERVALKGWEERYFLNKTYVTVDNSCALRGLTEATTPTCKEFDPSNGSVYVSHNETDPPATNPRPPVGDGESQGIEKFNASGEPVPFRAESYTTGNDIEGVPGESFTYERSDGIGTPGAMAIDGKGDIYVVDRNYNDSVLRDTNLAGAVVEYSPEGVFLRAFTGGETPGAGEDHENFGGRVEGVAVDPLSGDVLVAIGDYEPGDGYEPYAVDVIDEFNSSGEYLNQISEIEASPGVRQRLGHLGELTADSHGDVYAVDETHGAVDMWGPGVLPPSVRIAEPLSTSSSGAVLAGSVDTEKVGLSNCEFEYVTETAFDTTGFSTLSSGGSAPCEPTAGSIPKDSAYHGVQATVSDLQAGVTYRYRLVATTGGGLSATETSEPAAFTTQAAPLIFSSAVVDISDTSAELLARIDPVGAATSYHFEYSADGVSWLDAPVPDGEIGQGKPTGSADASVAQQVEGLEPGTTYYFRVVAQNNSGTATGAVCGGEMRPECAFTTLPRAIEGLPDGRAYELVTPPNKGSSEDMFSQPVKGSDFTNTYTVGYPSESGEEFLLSGKGAFGSEEHPFAASGGNAYVFRRGKTGWQTLPLASPSLGVQSITEDVLFDPADFSRVGFADDVGSGANPEGLKGVTSTGLVGPPGGPYETVHSELLGSKIGEIDQFVGASRNLSDVVVQTTDPGLLPTGQDAGSDALFEWSGGELALLSVNSEEAAFRCGATLGQGRGAGARHNAVSADGSRVFFTAPDPYASAGVFGGSGGPGCWGGGSSPQTNPPQLYMRSAEHTVELSAPEAGVTDPTGRHGAVYVGASENGSKVFFITEGELTAEAVALKLHDPELYECEITEEAGEPACKLTRVSAGEEGTPARETGSTGAHIWNVPAISEDGSAVYFDAFGALAPGASTLKVEEDGGPAPVNLYRYDTETGETTYVATVNTLDYPEGTTETWQSGLHMDIQGGGAALAPRANWYTTPDGRYLLFASFNELPGGYRTTSAGDCPPYNTQYSAGLGHCSEVYRYDAELPVSQGKPGVPDNPVCVSCDRSGALPVSDAYFAKTAAAQMPAGGSVRAMSDDGAYVFFDSADPLVPQATNGTLDVYEWQTLGTGGCELEEGCVSLISSGEDSTPSYFLGASSDGANVFFGTHAKLVPADGDESGDLYDARIDGGFPSPAGVGPCVGDSCESPPPAPIDATPGSLTFSGVGDLTSEPFSPPAKKTTKKVKCAKGKKLRHGKCVKAKTKPKKAKARKSNRRVK